MAIIAYVDAKWEQFENFVFSVNTLQIKPNQTKNQFLHVLIFFNFKFLQKILQGYNKKIRQATQVGQGQFYFQSTSSTYIKYYIY